MPAESSLKSSYYINKYVNNVCKPRWQGMDTIF